MKFYKSLLALAIGAAATAAHADIVTFDIAGQFGTSVDKVGLGGPYGTLLPPSYGDYPFSNLPGGSFSGTFSLDLTPAAAGFGVLSVTNVNFTSVNVVLRDSANAVVHTIDTGPNMFQVFNDTVRVRLGESFNGDAVMKPDDLRITFKVASLLPTNLTGASFVSGVSEVDADATVGGVSWDLEVASATLTSRVSVPPTSPVPEPASLGLFSLGLVALSLFGRVRRRRGASPVPAVRPLGAG